MNDHEEIEELAFAISDKVIKLQRENAKVLAI
jgi:hypothetical protein